MKYPMKEVDYSAFGGPIYREMTPEEYEDKLHFYETYAQNYKDDTSRRVKEYVDYLNRWFSDELCDGLDSFATRFKFHRLPMSPNQFMFE